MPFKDMETFNGVCHTLPTRSKVLDRWRVKLLERSQEFLAGKQIYDGASLIPNTPDITAVHARQNVPELIRVRAVRVANER